MKTISRLNPTTLPDFGQLGFSQISISQPGRIAYVSGQVAGNLEGFPVPEDLVEQVRIVGDNCRKAVKAVGATMQDVIMARVYVTDITVERLQQLMNPLRAIFDGAQPSLTGIGVAALAGTGLQIELELTVRIPD